MSKLLRVAVAAPRQRMEQAAHPGKSRKIPEHCCAEQ